MNKSSTSLLKDQNSKELSDKSATGYCQIKSASGSNSLKGNVPQSHVGNRRFWQAPNRQTATNSTRVLQILQPSDPRTTPIQNVPPCGRTQPFKKQTITKARIQRRPALLPSKDTEELWDILRRQKMSGYSQGTEASKNRAKRGGSASNVSRNASSRTSAVSGETKKTRLRDSDFRRKVLLPRGVAFPSTREFSDAFAHFETQRPHNGVDGYREISRGCHTAVWLSTDKCLVSDVAREYQYMRNEQLCEAEFATYAKEMLLWETLAFQATKRHENRE